MGLYARRDFDDPIFRKRKIIHMSAMTTEGLHSKADIADELAYRDVQIEKLKTKIFETLGWTIAEACRSVDSDIDIRRVNQAELLERAIKELNLPQD